MQVITDKHNLRIFLFNIDTRKTIIECQFDLNDEDTFYNLVMLKKYICRFKKKNQKFL